MKPELTLSVAVGIAAAAVLAFRLLARLLAPALGPVAGEAVLTLLLFGLLATVAIAAMRRDGGVRARLGPIGPNRVIAGAAVGAGGLAGSFLLAVLAGVGTRGATPAMPGLVLLGSVVVFVQATAEELYFRGWLLGALERHWGAGPALLVSALAFAALHLLGGARAPLSLVNLVLAGLLFGLLAQRSGGLAMPIAAHWAWNWAEGLLLGLDPNPGTGSFGALWDHDLVGVAYWGGSAEGLNASVAVTAALVILLLPLAAWPPRLRPALSRSGRRG